MKLVRFGAPGREKPGIIDDKGRIRDLSKVVADISGETLSPGKVLIKDGKIAALGEGLHYCGHQGGASLVGPHVGK